MQKIIPHLWFPENAEEAAVFYTSVFKDGKIGNKTYYTEVGHEIHGMEAGTVLTVEFDIEGYRFVGLNGGPIFKFTPAISFMVNCPSKEEVDELWEKLAEGGKPLMPLDSYPFSPRYGWIQDKYGVSWQLIYREEAQVWKIMPFFLFAGRVNGKAEEAINFYTSIFENSAIGTVVRHGPGQEPDKEGTIMYADFTLAGQAFAAMDSAQAHDFTFNEAVSLLVTCANQEGIDYYWEKLSAVPEAEQCGWLKDRYGVSWQIIPGGVDEILNGPDKERADRTMAALLEMKKIDMAALKNA